MTPSGALQRQRMFALFRAHGATAAFCLIAAFAIAFSRSSQAQNSPTEYELKAAFLYNFAKFVEWPPAKSPPDNGPFLVGVLGDDPFGSDLEKTLSGKQVNGRPVSILRSRNERQLSTCQILFIGASERRRISQIIETLRGGHVLTVSEIERFCQLGGIINFRMEENKVRFEINSVAAQSEQLKVSSKLLAVAAKVWRQPGSE